jgi:LytS/YehU family sensor histidine kinase
MRMGSRLDFSIDIPGALRTHPFPPVLLISIVENAVTHGLEPLAAGGHVSIVARQKGDRVLVIVEDTGIGLSGPSRRVAGWVSSTSASGCPRCSGRAEDSRSRRRSRAARALRSRFRRHRRILAGRDPHAGLTP